VIFREVLDLASRGGLTTRRLLVATSARAATNVSCSMNAASSRIRSRAVQPRTDRAVPGRERIREPFAKRSVDALSCTSRTPRARRPLLAFVVISVLCLRLGLTITAFTPDQYLAVWIASAAAARLAPTWRPFRTAVGRASRR
jgi:hypothetical protein